MRRSIAIVGIVIALPLWSMSMLSRHLHELKWDNALLDARVTPLEGVIFAHAAIIFASVALMVVLVPWGSLRSFSWRALVSRAALFRRPAAWLSAAVAVAPTTSVGPQPSTPTAAVPIGAVLSPALASSVLAHILRRRREQILSSSIDELPDRLTEEEVSVLASMSRLAIEYDTQAQGVVVPSLDGVHDPDAKQLLVAVERTRPRQHLTTKSGTCDWKVVVKVFGYPTVENVRGESAEFRKRRSLELLTWLALNRDRQRRSAARTAMWDIDISDSTFSTVISDMRRALTDLDGSGGTSEWCPPTYSDEIPLSRSVITDAELLDDALRSFKAGESGIEELSACLSWIRDAPFAGTAYSWADLDGTTTRLVILAVEAATTAARWARDHGRMDVLTAAVGAGLRVMPGCEELLSMQEEMVSATAVRRPTRPRR